MKTTKTYYIACDCKTGYRSLEGLHTATTEVCPVCQGSKIKPVIEVMESPDLPEINYTDDEKVSLKSLLKIISTMAKYST